MPNIEVRGWVDPSFADLPDILGRLAGSQPPLGAALSVLRDGRPVAELTVGTYPSPARQVVFSVSKVLLAIAVHRLVERGELDLDHPVSSYWEDFRCPSQPGLSVRDVLAHRSPLAALDVQVTLSDVLAGKDRDVVLREALTVPAAAGHGYHAVTFGTIIGAVVEAVAGRSAGDFLREEIAEPLGVDVMLGSADGELVPVRFAEPLALALPAPPAAGPRDGLLEVLVSDPQVFNSPEFLRAGLPSMGVVTTAPALARVMAATIGEVDGVRLISEATRRRMCETASTGMDSSLGITSTFGSGPQLVFPRLPWTGPQAFGHEGAGGAVAFADPERGLAVGFTTDLFPSSPGASPVLLGLLSTLRALTDPG